MAKGTRERPLRVGDPVPSDAVEFLEAYRQLPLDRQRAVIDCIKSMPPNLAGYEKVRRIGLALGHSEAVVAAMVQPLRRRRLRVV